MIMPVTEEQLESCNGGIRKLTELMQQHPNLPVIPMVDSEVMEDEGYARWSAKFGASPYIWDSKKKLLKLLQPEQSDFDWSIVNAMLEGLSDMLPNTNKAHGGDWLKDWFRKQHAPGAI